MPVTDWNSLPVVLTWQEAGEQILVRDYDGVRRAIKNGHLPEPTMTRPMRWSRAELQRHLGFPVLTQESTK